MSRTILITGCSSGIGAKAADMLKARGWHVIASARKPEDVARLADAGFDAVRLDYSDQNSVDDGWHAAMRLAGGPIDAVFNNAGHGMPGAAEDLPRDALECVFHSNVFGVHQLTRLATAHMLDHGGGRIVQHSSVLGYAPLKWRGGYVASKFALEGLTNTMRIELRGTGVHLSILNTGLITTSFREKSTIQFNRWIKPDTSRHAAFYNGAFMAERSSSKPGPFERPPEVVVRKLIHALEAPRPKPRYHITAPAYLAAALMRVLPTRAQDWVASKL